MMRWGKRTWDAGHGDRDKETDEQARQADREREQMRKRKNWNGTNRIGCHSQTFQLMQWVSSFLFQSDFVPFASTHRPGCIVHTQYDSIISNIWVLQIMSAKTTSCSFICIRIADQLTTTNNRSTRARTHTHTPPSLDILLYNNIEQIAHTHPITPVQAQSNQHAPNAIHFSTSLIMTNVVYTK